MANIELAARPGRSRHRPPERFHVFVSYTTREGEVRIVKPIVDSFLTGFYVQSSSELLASPRFSMMGIRFTTHIDFGRSRAGELEKALRFAIEESEVLVAFVSPEYFGSHWCTFECTTMATKELRPWFDLCREPPISELCDERPPNQLLSWWDCVRARFLMRRWRLRKKAWEPGGAIVAVLWKGEVDPFTEMPELGRLRLFNWTSCTSAIEVRAQVVSHLSKHGSVSPIWEQEARVLEEQCQQSMTATADAIAGILRRRRSKYAQRDGAPAYP